ncbi:hypothetical protein ABE28_009390 [Peribacillus muralis]|uniref:Uncharacterized protein n=1 Tax=Peribacillus muralis TaxID=264697 RepID=A0A1B3XMX3_9BACI|nr:hypothetical protein ABE28_009390 [Peribacillus muralis]
MIRKKLIPILVIDEAYIFVYGVKLIDGFLKGLQPDHRLNLFKNIIIFLYIYIRTSKNAFYTDGE